MPKIFISYRRADSQHVVGRIYDYLAEEFGEDDVFKDVNSIDGGEDFHAAVHEAIHRCEFVLIVIGDQWLTILDEETGKPRIHSPDDLVRLEAEWAHSNSGRVVPVLVDNTPMPTHEELPSSLSFIPKLNAMSVRPDPDFSIDMGRLLDLLSRPARDRQDNEPDRGSRRTRAAGLASPEPSWRPRQRRGKGASLNVSLGNFGCLLTVAMGVAWLLFATYFSRESEDSPNPRRIAITEPPDDADPTTRVEPPSSRVLRPELDEGEYEIAEYVAPTSRDEPDVDDRPTLPVDLIPDPPEPIDSIVVDPNAPSDPPIDPDSGPERVPFEISPRDLIAQDDIQIVAPNNANRPLVVEITVGPNGTSDDVDLPPIEPDDPPDTFDDVTTRPRALPDDPILRNPVSFDPLFVEQLSRSLARSPLSPRRRRLEEKVVDLVLESWPKLDAATVNKDVGEMFDSGRSPSAIFESYRAMDRRRRREQTRVVDLVLKLWPKLDEVTVTKDVGEMLDSGLSGSAIVRSYRDADHRRLQQAQQTLIVDSVLTLRPNLDVETVTEDVAEMLDSGMSASVILESYRPRSRRGRTVDFSEQ